MSAMIAIFAFAWFVGWAVTMRKLRDLIIDIPVPRKIAAVSFLFVTWPLYLFFLEVAR